MKQRMFCCVLSSAWKLSSYTYDYYVIFVQAGVYDKVYLFGNNQIIKPFVSFQLSKLWLRPA